MATFTFATTDGSSTVYLTQNALGTLRVWPTEVLVTHGARTVVCSVVPIIEEGNVIPVTPDVLAGAGILDDIPYRLRWTGPAQLSVGPVIGIHVADGDLASAPLPGGFYSLFLLKYPQVQGLVYVFGTSGIDIDQGVIEGYYWQPTHGPVPVWETPEKMGRLASRVRDDARAEAIGQGYNARTERFLAAGDRYMQETSGSPVLAEMHTALPGSGGFRPGRFPFPSAVWRRSGYLPASVSKALRLRLSGRVYNSSFFDKLYGYELVSRYPGLTAHIPDTRVLQDFGTIEEFLDRDGSVVLKRREGNSGYGMMLVDSTGTDYELRVRESRSSERFQDIDSLLKRLASATRGRQYLVQRRVYLPSYNGRLVDFRVFMQKDDRARWVVQAIVGRFGATQSIVTSFINRGYATDADEAIRRAFNVNWRQAYRLKVQLVDLAMDVCEALDDSGGSYGDLGLDIGIDVDRRTWLFEVNKLPFHEMLLYAGDQQGYFRVKSGPLLYGAYLAGFGQDTETPTSSGQ